MAGEDLTGPPVLKIQSRARRTGSVPLATPVRAGSPRNIGQASSIPSAPEISGHSTHIHAARTHKVFSRASIFAVRCRIITQAKDACNQKRARLSQCLL